MTPLSRRSLIAAAAGTAGAALAPAAGAQAPAPGDMSLGDPRAPVRVVEYASLTCGHCAQFHTQVFPAFKAKYVDTGRVHYTLREFLTDPAQLAAAGYLIARCAGPGRYFDVVDAVFRSQDQWRGDVKGVFVGIAARFGLSEPQMMACIQDRAALDHLNARVARAVEQDKVEATPTFFVNGRKVKEGAMTLAELDAAIAAARAARR